MKLFGKKGIGEEEIWGPIILMILFLGLGIALVIFGIIGNNVGTVKAKIEGATISSACDIDLVNFLRADSGKGLTFAEMVAVAAKHPEYAGVLRDSAIEFMERNYRRGVNQKSLWRVTLKLPGTEAPFLTFGTLDRPSGLDTCSKIVPTLTPASPYKVELALEY